MRGGNADIIPILARTTARARTTCSFGHPGTRVRAPLPSPRGRCTHLLAARLRRARDRGVRVRRPRVPRVAGPAGYGRARCGRALRSPRRPPVPAARLEPARPAGCRITTVDRAQRRRIDVDAGAITSTRARTAHATLRTHGTATPLRHDRARTRPAGADTRAGTRAVVAARPSGSGLRARARRPHALAGARVRGRASRRRRRVAQLAAGAVAAGASRGPGADAGAGAGATASRSRSRSARSHAKRISPGAVACATASVRSTRPLR